MSVRIWHRAPPTPLAAVVALLLATGSACTSGEDRTDPVLRENELIARTLLAAWEQGDVTTLQGLFRPDAVYDDFPDAIQHQGLAEIMEYLDQVHRWGSDVVVNVTSVAPSPGGATAEWVLSAVQTAALEGRVDIGTGSEVILNGVTLLEIRGGLISRAADYVDMLPLVLQTGGRVELPGGGVIEPGGR